ncbi:hypothetical protein KX816_09550 [Sphingosinicellaceae bacterium]|nr:hypothetical protein KX816_09550 [Sphingosinicellaceae bacterium]
MSLSIAVGQVTLALRDMLFDALVADPGWQLTGLPAAVQVQPYSVISGQGLTLWMVGIDPDASAANAAPARRARETTVPYEVTLLLTAESDLPLFAHLMIGVAVEALSKSPLLPMPPEARPTDRAIEAAIKVASGAAATPLRLIVEAVKPAEFAFARLPALMVRAGPLRVATPAVVPIR